jgi:hypothetical protein
MAKKKSSVPAYEAARQALRPTTSRRRSKGATERLDGARKRRTAKRRARSASRRVAKKNPSRPRSSLVSNPPALQDLTELVLPSLAGYGATRFVARILYSRLIKRWPKFAKHGAVLSSIATAAAAWFLVHRFKRLAKYHTPVVIGSSIAAAQAVLQSYLPKFGWIVSDFQDTNALLKAPVQADPDELDGYEERTTYLTPGSRPPESGGGQVQARRETALVNSIQNEDLGSLSDSALSIDDADLDQLLADSGGQAN